MRNSMNKDHHKKQNPRQKIVMDESTKMTIEFLRARLLSERSISRAARQRAEELAKRVVELEEQLRIVNLQRRKAEKATSELLTILENGISDLSEYESSSDQEGVAIASNDGHRFTMEDETSRRLTNNMENGFALNAHPSTIQQHLDESSSQIKQQGRSEALQLRDGPLLLDPKENGGGTGTGIVHNLEEIREILKEDSRCEDENFCGGTVEESQETPRKYSNDGFFPNGTSRNVEMEQALRQQAQLIGQYEEAENAQREWEEKFRENQSSTPDSYEHGNQSDVTEERDEVRVEAAETGYTVPSPSQGEKKVVQKVCHSGDAMVKSVPGRFLPPHVESRSSQEQQFNSSTHGPETGSPEFSFSGQENLEAKANETQRQEWSANNSSHSNGPSEHLARQKFSSFQMNGSIYKGESSGTEIQVARPCHEIPIELGGVLESLQRAKLSLKQELNRSPQSIREMSLMRAIEAPLPANMKKDPMEIPVRYAGLFRVPTSLKSEAIASKSSSVGPYSDTSSLTRYNTRPGVGFASSDGYTSSSNMDTQSDISTRRRLSDPYTRYMHPPHPDLGMTLPSSTRYMHPPHPDLTPRMLIDDRHSQDYLNYGSRDRFSVYNNQIRSNMHTL